MAETALIVGAGAGLSAALARRFAGEGMRIALVARSVGKLADLAAETGAHTYAADCSEKSGVEEVFSAVATDIGTPDLVVYNPSFRTRGPIAELDPDDVERALRITCFGGFLVGQAAARGMLAAGHGTILFTGASASIKGYANSAAFAMGKFGLRGLAQSMARELSPKNIHVAHFIIDGAILPPAIADDGAPADSRLRPESIAETYLHVHRQHRSAWTSEVELRPWGESF